MFRRLPFLVSFIYQDSEFRERSAILLTANSKQVLELLSMYMQANGTFVDILSFVSLIKLVV